MAVFLFFIVTTVSESKLKNETTLEKNVKLAQTTSAYFSQPVQISK